MIKTANECKKLRDYNAVFAIVSGLNLVSVSRLKVTWEAVDPRRVKHLRDLEAFVSPTGNYKVYRQAVEALDPREYRIPIISLFLKDLFFMNEGNPKYIEVVESMDKAKKLINMEKLFNSYDKVVVFCNTKFNPPLDPSAHTSEANARSLVENMKTLKESALYKYSCLCEAKSGDAEVNLRSKWMTEG